MKRRPGRAPTRLVLEQLETRHALSATVSLSSGTFALTDAGTPTGVSVALASGNYTITDSDGITGSISGWTIAGTTATETDGHASLVTQMNFTVAGGTATSITAGAANLDFSCSGSLTITGAISTSGSFTKAGGGQLTLTNSNNNYTGETFVNTGQLLVDGSLTSTSSVSVAGNATLAGAAGTISAPVAVSGTLTTGDNSTTTGTLGLGNLSFSSGSAMNFTLDGPTAGGGYGQITGNGTINLTGAKLGEVNVGNGYTPPIGATYDVLVNDGGSAITGTFPGFPEGAVFSEGNYNFRVSYVGGASHHDVVLTAVAVTTTSLTDNSPSSTTYGSSVSFTVTTTGGAPDGTVVTLEDENNSDAIVGTGALTSQTANINVSNLAVGTHSLFAVYPGDLNYVGSLSGNVNAQVTVAVTAVVNGNSASLEGVQRSMVDSIVYTFNQAVNLNPSTAFTIAPHAGEPGVAPTLSWAAASNGTNLTTWIVTFTGNNTVDNSILDGVYDITLNEAAVTTVATVVGGGNVAMTANKIDTFYRLFGDALGSRRVNAANQLALFATYGKQVGATGYSPYFDLGYEYAGGLYGVDVGYSFAAPDTSPNSVYVKFLANYGKHFSGFTATI